MTLTLKQVLVGRIERALDDGGHVFTKKFILGCVNGDLDTATACLQQWESEGKLEILKPLDEAGGDEPVVKMKSYIEGKSPWPNWPSKD